MRCTMQKLVPVNPLLSQVFPDDECEDRSIIHIYDRSSHATIGNHSDDVELFDVLYFPLVEAACLHSSQLRLYIFIRPSSLPPHHEKKRLGCSHIDSGVMVGKHERRHSSLRFQDKVSLNLRCAGVHFMQFRLRFACAATRCSRLRDFVTVNEPCSAKRKEVRNSHGSRL